MAIILLSGNIFSKSIFAQGWQMYLNELKENRGKTSAKGPSTSSLPETGSNRSTGGAAAMKQRGNMSQNTGLRRALDFQNVLKEDYRTGTPSYVNAPVEKEIVQEKQLPSYRTFSVIRNTATLNDVFFLDPMFGWAVGNRGTIWMTTDGGGHWLLNNLSIGDNLHAIHFIDRQIGIAVGGAVLPGGKNGRGLILRTEDGGKSWHEIRHTSFPILRKVQFQDRNRVWIAGDSSELYPGGIFLSQDSGRTWTADKGNRHSGWNDLAWDPINRRGIGIGTNGAFLTLKGAERKEKSLPIGNRRLNDLVCTQMNDPLRMAGDSGLLLQSIDGGENWTDLGIGLAPDTRKFFDFNSLYAAGPNVWVAGTPGSLIFFSNDAGKNWNASFTGVRVPLNRIFFSDALHGWAVGELGTILATQDGGRTWTIQREGGRRLAMLALWCNGETIPWELFVQYAGEEGFLTRLQILCRDMEKEKTNDEIPNILRLQEAIVETGADSLADCSSFRIDSKTSFSSVQKIFEQFDRENDNKGLERFRELLVRWIRIWRPSLILIEDGTKDSLAEFLEKELPLAIQNAADPLVLPEQLTLCRLEPWTVDRVEKIKKSIAYKTEADPNTLNTNGSPNNNEFVLDSGSFCPALGRSIGEIARMARSYIEPPDSDLPRHTRLLRLYNRPVGNATPAGIPSSGQNIGLFSGIDLPFGSEARRLRLEGIRSERDRMAARADQRRRLLGIIENIAKRKDLNSEILIAQINEMTRGLDSNMAVEYLLKIGNELYRAGRWTAAEEVYSKIALDYPLTPLSREAFIWLTAYYTGTEPFWLMQDKNRWSSATTKLGTQDRQGLGQSNTPTALSRLAVDTGRGNPRLGNADDLGKAIRDFLPELYMDPNIRFPLAMAQRVRGYTNDALKYYLNRSLVSRDDLWGVRARAEFWLNTPNRGQLAAEDQFCPIATAACRSILNKPFLDGVLEPNVWSNADRFSLSKKLPEAPSENEQTKQKPVWQLDNLKMSTEFGTFVSFLYDKEFLYIGIECRKVKTCRYPKDTRPRDRDSDLSDFDRIEIQFDVDRDYTTCWKFVFDSRGWAQEAAWNNSRWDPKIFIAQHEDKDQWTLEIAVPWEELAQQPPGANDVWALSCRRIVPQNGLECWNAAFSEKGENAFGFLSFGMTNLQ